MSRGLNDHRARIYVSFADEDRVRAMELVRWLNDCGWRVMAGERHAFPPAAAHPSPQLDACDLVLCVVTPGWLVSSHCHRELAHARARGKLILPVVCERTAFVLLPPELAELPRIDLTEGGLIDYLALKDALNRAGANLPAELPGKRTRALWRQPVSPRGLALALGGLAAVAMAGGALLGALWR
jgi:hypothetical protein